MLFWQNYPTPMSALTETLIQRYLDFTFSTAPKRREELVDANHLPPELVGGIFQQTAYACVNLMQDSDRYTVLSPQRTFALFTSLFPNARVIPHAYGLDSLKGISVPDGVRMDYEEVDGTHTARVATWFECTLRRDLSPIIERKLYALKHMQISHPNLFAETTIEIVVPEWEHKRDKPKKRSGVDIVELPFTRGEFSLWVREAVRNCINRSTKSTSFYPNVNA